MLNRRDRNLAGYARTKAILSYFIKAIISQYAKGLFCLCHLYTGDFIKPCTHRSACGQLYINSVKNTRTLKTVNFALV